MKVKPEDIDWVAAGWCSRRIASLIDKAGYTPPECYGELTKLLALEMNSMGTALCMLPPEDGLNT